MILNIDTSTETASICLADQGVLYGQAQNPVQKEHAEWLHPAIQTMLAQAGIKARDLQAVAVTSGPGSYTGLRVGLAAAKGMCYALGIPLLTENTLKILALTQVEQARLDQVPWICPMIDARRMEVFTALYTSDLQESISPRAQILENNSFEQYLRQGPVLFIGSGVPKWKAIAPLQMARFAASPPLAPALARWSQGLLERRQLTDIRLSEPVYLKEFHTHTKK